MPSIWVENLRIPWIRACERSSVESRGRTVYTQATPLTTDPHGLFSPIDLEERGFESSDTVLDGNL